MYHCLKTPVLMQRSSNWVSRRADVSRGTAVRDVVNFNIHNTVHCLNTKITMALLVAYYETHVWRRRGKASSLCTYAFCAVKHHVTFEEI